MVIFHSYVSLPEGTCPVGKFHPPLFYASMNLWISSVESIQVRGESHHLKGTTNHILDQSSSELKRRLIVVSL